MAADVNVIALAAEGVRERDNAMAWHMFRAAKGIPPPDLTPRTKPPPPTASEIKAWAKEHNIRRAEGERIRAARAAALAKARDGKSAKS